MARHFVVILAGLLILLCVWYSFKLKPMLEKGKSKITITLDGQPREMTADEIAGEIQRLRRELFDAHRRARELEEAKQALLDDLENWMERARKAERQRKPPEPGGDGGSIADPTEAALKEALASTDWVIYIRAILEWTKMDEESRRTGKPPSFDPRTIQLLSEYTTKLTELANILGVADSQEVIYHEKIFPVFFEAWMRGVGVTLTVDQRASMTKSCVEFSRSREKALPEIKEANKLEQLAWAAAWDMRWNEDVKRFLTPEQYEAYMKPAGGDPFWRCSAPRRNISAETPAGAAQKVGELWASSFGLDAASRAIVNEVATSYVQEYQRRVQDFEARFGDSPPLEEQMHFAIDLLELQIESESQLVRRLTLTPEQQKRVRAGTGTIFQLDLK